MMKMKVCVRMCMREEIRAQMSTEEGELCSPLRKAQPPTGL